MPNSPFAHSLFSMMLFQALLFMISAMALIWALSAKWKNAGIVDIAWAAFFLPVCWLYAAVGDAYTNRKLLIAAMVAIWSARLSIYLYLRVVATHPKEDARYTKMRVQWGEHAERNMFLLFQLQGVMIVLLTIPFALICMNSESGITPLECGAAALWLISLLGEALSDRQLHQFKRSNPGKTCNVGFWKYSRHPNYFFEWLIWCSYFLFALASPYGWVSIFCPLLMYYVLTRVTGIPMAEEQSLKSRGEEYRGYQQKTSAFFLWFPKKV